MRARCDVIKLGVIEYRQAWELQETLAAEIAGLARPPTLLLLQHPHTYTFGRKGKPEHLLWDEARLAQEGVELVWSDRGGDITYHGPGQLVGYPLLPLGALYGAGSNLAPQMVQRDAPELAAESQPAPQMVQRDVSALPANAAAAQIPKADYVGYLRRLEETLILALLRLGVGAGQIPGLTGVWLQTDVRSRCLRCAPELRWAPAKIAAIGVKVDARGVSRHGFALNADPEMRFWEGIVACGLQGYAAASLAELLDPPPEMEQVAGRVAEAFGEVFGFEMVEVA